MAFSHIAYRDGVLTLLDQTKLPARVEHVELRSWPPVAHAIRTMVVRGAPAIGIAGAYGMALAAREHAGKDSFEAGITRAAEGLIGARPTAVNLAWAVTLVRDELLALAAGVGGPPAVIAAAERRAREIHDDDIARCRAIGDLGADLIPPGGDVLTHCNTGSLATGGYGTALGIVRSAWRAKKLGRVYVAETRPLLQGARLTAWELAQDGIPHVLITDSTAASIMRGGGIGAVLVGADRIARNGDVANKIGTYALATLARAHDIAFIVAAPLSTFDPHTATGDHVVIEQRDPNEVTHVGGIATAPADTVAANPAFDVTPAELITAIVCERGVLRPPLARAIAQLQGAVEAAAVRS